jgi:hypothetical protein
MRLVEVSNLDAIAIIPDRYCFLQTHYDYMNPKFYIISLDNKNIKVKFRNKNILIYKDYSEFTQVRQIEYMYKNFSIRYRPNFIGFFNTKDGVLIKSRQYSGIISIWDIIKLLTNDEISRI